MKRYKINNTIVKAKSITDAVKCYKAMTVDVAVTNHDEDTTLQSLIDDEIEAVDNYRSMIAKTTDPALLAVLAHIMSEESEHIEELRLARAGKFDTVHDSIKDGKYVFELVEGDVITMKDGSKWIVSTIRNTPFGIQVRMNSETSPVKTKEVTYNPTDMLTDSIQDEETEHVEELRAAQAGVYEVKDSVKDDTVMFPGSKLRRVAIKYGFLNNEKLAKKIAADSEWQAIIKKYKDPLWSAPSAIDEIVKKYMLTDSIQDEERWLVKIVNRLGTTSYYGGPTSKDKAEETAEYLRKQAQYRTCTITVKRQDLNS